MRFCGVSAAVAAAPSGVVTFLLTDVEGSRTPGPVPLGFCPKRSSSDGHQNMVSQWR